VKAQAMFGMCAQVVQAVASADTPEDSAKSVELLKSQCAPMAAAVLEEQTKVVDDLVAYAKTTAISVSAEARSGIRLAVMLVTLGLALSLAGAMWVGIGGLSRPIGNLNTAMERLAAGDLQVNVQEVSRRDEIGQMARAVEVFKTNGIEVEKLKAQQAETEGRASKQRKQDMERLTTAFEDMIGEIIHNVSSAATRMESSANSLTVTAEKTAELSSVVTSAGRYRLLECEVCRWFSRGDGIDRSRNKFAVQRVGRNSWPSGNAGRADERRRDKALGSRKAHRRCDRHDQHDRGANQSSCPQRSIEALVALIREAGSGRFIETVLDFCRKCVGADFVSILAYSKAGDPTLVGTATTTAADNARKAAIGYMRHFANDVNFNLVSRRRLGAYITYRTADEIASPQYRRACYERTGIADRLSLLRVESA
jgi:HAMP domain-containing protein